MAATRTTVHMDGHDGVVEGVVQLLTGLAQGCPPSAMVFGIVPEVRSVLALECVPQCSGLGGVFNHLGYMDDTTWCLDTEADLRIFAANWHRANLLTNLFSSAPKQLLVCASYEGF